MRAGGEITFAGKVGHRGAVIDKQGKLVEVQVKVRRHWRAVGTTVRSGPKGRFELRHRFASFYTEPTQFRFRAVALSERSWPYLQANSRRHKVTVIPGS